MALSYVNERYIQALACAVARDKLMIAIADCVIDCARILDANFRMGAAPPSIDRLAKAMETFQEFLPK